MPNEMFTLKFYNWFKFTIKCGPIQMQIADKLATCKFPQNNIKSTIVSLFTSNWCKPIDWMQKVGLLLLNSPQLYCLIGFVFVAVVVVCEFDWNGNCVSFAVVGTVSDSLALFARPEKIHLRKSPI